MNINCKKKTSFQNLMFVFKQKESHFEHFTKKMDISKMFKNIKINLWSDGYQ